MKDKSVRAIAVVSLCLGMGVALFIFTQVIRVQADGRVPALAYLGEGGSYSVGEGYNFIVKTRHPFRFTFMPGPEYTASADERVWSVLGNVEPPRPNFQEIVTVGPVQQGCIIEFATIDDDEDDRVNHFLLNGGPIYAIGQGMVSRGRFMIPMDGTLSYQSEDSIGMFLSVCEDMETPQPTETPTVTPTNTPENTPTPTPTGTITITPTIPPTFTPTVEPTTEPEIMTPTPSPSPTPPKDPRLPSCLRINFDVSGQEAKRGLYIAQETGGRYLAAWEADNGWKDSGWFYDIDITFEAVYVEVLYYHGPGVEPVRLRILNPAPDTENGWLARGMCHALEVGWP